MKGLFYFICSAIYGLITSYLLWLAFYFLSAWAIEWSWFALIVYSSMFFGLIFGLLGGISSIAISPLISMCKKYPSLRYVSIVLFLFYGCCSVACPWRLLPSGLREVLISILLSVSAISIFGALIYGIWNARSIGE